jgi:DNA repair/transcription protein MET18/MMS19
MNSANLDKAVEIVETLGREVLQPNNSANTARTLFWISKALLLRLHAVDKILTQLLNLLGDEKCGGDIAIGFSLLFAPDEILSKENGANIRLLSKHKAFALCVPAIRERFLTAPSNSKPNYLIALCGILMHMDSKIVMPEMKSLLPLLLQCLDLPDSAVRRATIEVLTVAVKESPLSIEEHLLSLITRLLNIAGNRKENDSVSTVKLGMLKLILMQLQTIRLQALRCVRTFPGSIKELKLIPYTNVVDRGIAVALDDPRRNVRKEAVDCRATWLKVEEPEEDD